MCGMLGVVWPEVCELTVNKNIFSCKTRSKPSSLYGQWSRHDCKQQE